MKDLITKYPVTTFYIITFIISWGGLTLLVGGPGGITAQPATVPFLRLYLITVAGPLLSGILLTGLYHQKKGYTDLLRRLFKWRVPVKWYAIALLAAPLTVFAALFILTIFSPSFLPGIFDSGANPVASSFGLSGSDKTSLAVFVLMLGLFNGLVEELGWTGFATPQMLNQNLLEAGARLGFMWGLWHLLSNYLGSEAAAGNVPLSLYMVVMLFSFLPPFRVLMLWVYKKTGSLMIAVLMHASLDVFWLLSMPVSITGKERMAWYLVWAAVLWALVIIVYVTGCKKRSAYRGSFI